MSGWVGLLLGAGFGLSLALLLAAASGWRPQRLLGRGRRAGRNRRWFRAAARRRAGYAASAALLVAVLTRWPVAVAATAGLVWCWPLLFGAAAASAAQMDRLEALATWTESLRDTIAGSIGLEQAIPRTVAAAAPVLQPALVRMTGLIRAHVPLPQALAGFAEEFDDPSADLVVAALILNARLRGPGLAGTLTALAATAREELEMRQRVEAGRKSLRRAALIIVTVTLVVAGALVLFSRDYVAPYASTVGQLVLALVMVLFGAAFWWMRKVAEAPMPERFLAGPDQLARLGDPRIGWEMAGGAAR